MLLITIGTRIQAQELQPFSKDNIRFQMPASWVVQPIPQYYILVSEAAQPTVQVLTTFDVEIDSVFSDLDSFCTDYEARLSKSEVFLNFVVLEKKPIDFHGMPAIEYHCKATAMSMPMEWKSVVFVKNGKVYKLSTASLIGQFKLQEQATNQIFDSFEID